VPDYSGSYATPRADLGEALIEYRRENGGNWIGTKILPTIDVMKKSATFSVFTRASILQVADVKRAPRGRYNRIESEVKDFTYNCQNYGMEGAVDDSERELYSSDFDADFTCLTVVERVVRLAQEQRISALVFGTSTVAAAGMNTNYTDNSSAAPWTSFGTDIYGQILDAKETSRRLTGMLPNTIAVNRPVWNLMKKNTALSSKFKFPNAAARGREAGIQTDQLVEEEMRALFGVEQILIGDEVYNAAAELNPNSPMESVTDVWVKEYCLVLYACKLGSSLSEPCLGRTAVWVEFAGDFEVQSYREEKIESDIVRCKHFVQEFIRDQSYGTLIKVQT